MSAFRLRTRETAEELERKILSPAATLSVNAEGRAIPEALDPWRTAFERDRDRILHSKAFRRLKHKTQVFMNPEGDHYVTRLTHTLQVTQVGGAIARALSLNGSLTEAICLGHDVGHSPFGHTGEDALSEFVEDEWRHSAQSVRIFEVLEPLNLTSEVLDGILAHPWKIATPARTPEGAIVRFADRIAYLAHDGLDAIRAHVLRPADFPQSVLDTLGEPGSEWIDTMITSVVTTSMERDEVAMDDHTLDVMLELRGFMFENVYLRADVEPQRIRAREIIRNLVEYYVAHPSEIPATYRHDDADTLIQVIDFVAGMTDRYAISRHDALFRPALF
jgi:dGTPase